MLAMLGDWLQGPHVYVLYESYNMTKHEIEILFIAGFGSSMLFGTIIGYYYLNIYKKKIIYIYFNNIF